MDDLQRKALEYEELLPFDYRFQLVDGREFTLVFRASHFAHLVGLHKLRDLPTIHRMNQKNDATMTASILFKEIREGRFGWEDIQKSIFIEEISLRLASFGQVGLMCLLTQDTIIDFDRSKTASELAKADFIFVFRCPTFLEHLAIGADENHLVHFPYSFFIDHRDYYVRDQKIVGVRRLDVVDHKNPDRFTTFHD